jgi:hypothetical protein
VIEQRCGGWALRNRIAAPHRTESDLQVEPLYLELMDVDEGAGDPQADRHDRPPFEPASPAGTPRFSLPMLGTGIAGMPG